MIWNIRRSISGQPAKPLSPAAIITLFEDETGKRYHHIFDGHTGYPSETGLDSATNIITDVSMNADALFIAVFVMGLERGTALRGIPGKYRGHLY